MEVRSSKSGTWTALLVRTFPSLSSSSAGQAAADVGLVKVDARLRRGGRVLHVEEVQAVGDAAVGPRHGDVPEHGGEVELAEAVAPAGP